MIKIRRGFGFAIVKASHEELTRLLALNGTELKAGDKVVRLPYKHHVHRNPNYPALIKIIEDKERADADAGKAGLQ